MFLYLLYQSHKYYKDLKGLLDINTHISEINQGENPKSKHQQMINTHNMMLERCKLKLDLLKSFSPIPIVIFISGIFVNSDAGMELIYFQLETLFSIESIYTTVVALFLVWYINSIRTSWDKYKTVQLRNLQYQNAYDKC